MLQDYEFYFTENGTLPDVSNSAANATASSKKTAKFNALITTFEVVLSDVPLFCEFKWRNIIIDEAHRLKNKNCKLIEGKPLKPNKRLTDKDCTQKLTKILNKINFSRF